MDLAKIRKKSLQAIKELDDERCAVQSPFHEPAKSILEADTSNSIDTNLTQVNEPYSAPVELMAAEPPLFAGTNRDHAVSARTPIEAILAGRTAAGCDAESILADDVTSQVVIDSPLEFLCFRVSDEIYGINIMDIKEIIKPREVTEVPRAPAFVSGVLSLRGVIISIIDMRIRLGLSREQPTGKERIVVIKIDNSFSGLLVDEVIQVVQVRQDAVESAPAVLDGIDRDFISGLGRFDGQLIIILNLENIADINLY